LEWIELKKKIYTSKTLRMTNYLAKKYDIIGTAPDRNNPRYVVFLFEDSNELREYLSKYNNGLNK
jgi:hypothetical protein